MARGSKNLSRSMAANTAKKIPDVLTRQEMEEIAYIMAVEKVWFDAWKENPENHWIFRGEDGHGEHEVEVFDFKEIKEVLYIDMRGHHYALPAMAEEEVQYKEIGWVPAERVVPWKPGVVPRVINLFVERWFGVGLFGYGLYFYYLCQPFMQLIGGRGSGKTTQIALASIAWIALHPGENWVHFAYTLEQAKLSYQIVSQLGKESTMEAGGTTGADGRSFFDIWVQPGGFRESPYPRIQIRSWNKYDPGNTIDYRPLNPSHGSAQNRSFSCARASLDEVTRDVDDENVLAVAEGTVRGPNMVKLKQLPTEDKRRVHDLMQIQQKLENLGYDDPESENYHRYKAVIQEIDAYGLSRHGGRIRLGNKGTAPWIEERERMSEEFPQLQYAETVPFFVNPWLSASDRRNYLENFRDPDQAREELLGISSEGSGNFFTVGTLRRAESAKLSELYRQHGDFKKWSGYTYQGSIPWEPGYSYVICSDPGTGRIPYRNAYIVMAWRMYMDRAGAELVYFDWGGVAKPANSWRPFLNSLELARVSYKVQPLNCTVCVGGTEEGILEARFSAIVNDQIDYTWDGSDEERDIISHLQYVNPVHLTGSSKFTAANLTREMLGYGWLHVPDEFASFRNQFTGWDANNDKKIAQDIVAAVFGGAKLMYSYMSNFLEKKEEDPNIWRRSNTTQRSARWIATRF